MRKLLCWLLGHDHMNTSARYRVCVRCDARETLRNYGDVLAWEAVAKSGARG